MKTKFLAVIGCWMLTARPASRTIDLSRRFEASATVITPLGLSRSLNSSTAWAVGDMASSR